MMDDDDDDSRMMMMMVIFSLCIHAHTHTYTWKIILTWPSKNFPKWTFFLFLLLLLSLSLLLLFNFIYCFFFIFLNLWIFFLFIALYDHTKPKMNAVECCNHHWMMTMMTAQEWATAAIVCLFICFSEKIKFFYSLGISFWQMCVCVWK